MLQFVLFAGSKFYPNKAWEDFKGSYATMAEAYKGAAIERGSIEWWQIVDLETGLIVDQFEEDWGR